MYMDVVDLRAFYSDRLGIVAKRLIGERLRQHWPDVGRGQSLLGIGYATPYLTGFDQAERIMAFMPAAQGVVNWPADGLNRSALIADDALPLPDGCIDRVLVVHSLEMVDSPSDQLREIWRVLTPHGRVILVVPNRSGVWSRSEATPFGYGRPFGRGQLTTVLRETKFSPIAWSEALAFPPFRHRPLLTSGVNWERVGRIMWPAFSGVIIVEANKTVHQGVRVTKRLRGLRPSLRPALLRPGT
jgi:SAM-dependent methyltransferase